MRWPPAAPEPWGYAAGGVTATVFADRYAPLPSKVATPADASMARISGTSFGSNSAAT